MTFIILRPFSKISHVKNILLILTLLLSYEGIKAQGLELGGWLGTTQYFGDLNTNFRFKDPFIAGGVIARYNFNERLATKLSINYGRVSADDADSANSFERARNLSFRSNLFDAAFQFEFNFLPYVHGSSDRFYSPYLFVGFGVTHFNPKANLNGDWIALQPLGTEGQFFGEEYYLTSGAWVVGGGFKLSITYEWSFNVELSLRQMFTDYLDDVSTTYPDRTELRALRGDTAVLLSDRSSPQTDTGLLLGEEGRQRGNSNDNDSVAFLGIGLTYYFGSVKCPNTYKYR